MTREERLARMRGWRAVNRDKERARVVKWQAAHPEKVRANMAKWRAANPEKARAGTANWCAANRDKDRARKKKYRLSKPEKWRAYCAARRARKIAATPAWADAELIADMYAEAEYQQMHVDHIVPLRSKFVCGLHWEGNLQLLAMNQNLSKGNRLWPGQ